MTIISIGKLLYMSTRNLKYLSLKNYKQYLYTKSNQCIEDFFLQFSVVFFNNV